MPLGQAARPSASSARMGRARRPPSRSSAPWRTRHRARPARPDATRPRSGTRYAATSAWSSRTRPWIPASPPSRTCASTRSFAACRRPRRGRLLGGRRGAIRAAPVRGVLRADPVGQHHCAQPAGSLPFRARHRPVLPGRPQHAAARQVQDVYLSGCSGDVSAVHRDIIGRVNRVGQGVRIPPRDPGRTGSRASIVIGKCLGGATIATFQGIVVPDPGGLRRFAVPPGADCHPHRRVAAAVIHPHRLWRDDGGQDQAVPGIHGAHLDARNPLFFLSGALYPLSGRPAWLGVLTRIDTLTYIVGPMRHAVFSHLSIPALFEQHLAPGITWGGWLVPLWLSIGTVAIMAWEWWPWRSPSFARRSKRSARRNKRHPWKDERRRVATGANHPASHTSALRRGPGTPAQVPRRGTRAPVSMLHRNPP